MPHHHGVVYTREIPTPLSSRQSNGVYASHPIRSKDKRIRLMGPLLLAQVWPVCGTARHMPHSSCTEKKA
eukprot:1608166-Pyramimonas_sp.AAC.1